MEIRWVQKNVWNKIYVGDWRYTTLFMQNENTAYKDFNHLNKSKKKTEKIQNIQTTGR